MTRIRTRNTNRQAQRQVVLNLAVPLSGDGLIEDEQFEQSLLTLLRYAACTPTRKLFETLSLAGSMAQMERLGMGEAVTR